MTRNDFAQALRILARDQRQVVTVGQLSGIGVSEVALRKRCGPGGPWQRVLPRVVVLRRGALSAWQRCRAALAYAGYPAAQAQLTGIAALALHGMREVLVPAEVRVVDVLVPAGRALRTHTWVRVHHARTLPGPELVDELPVAPLVRAAGDGVRASCDPDWVRAVLRELVWDRGVDPAELAGELRTASLSRKPGIDETLRELALPGRVRRPLGGQLRSLVALSGSRPPLWRPELRLDGVFLASPDAYWAREGVALVIGPAAGPNPLDTCGLRIVRVPPEALTASPAQVVAALRAALGSGPHGPLDRVTVHPDHGSVKGI
ncbi:hypothetical protein C8250_013725 [Streptomyces sp. So13.3]|uniref:hypothetical protein n=1 Tax=Streptomyces TaxID=1883 RepID=UPI00110639FB|nr:MULTISPECIES: hypothetical protein [Streptomyces]MCZ4096278.1 hypothetical protein [Streptomyces sp. H39-C1]QNA72833.1 hypothetical protein C8250_013725 [Streptomyces sp. So13.3]